MVATRSARQAMEPRPATASSDVTSLSVSSPRWQAADSSSSVSSSSPVRGARRSANNRSISGGFSGGGLRRGLRSNSNSNSNSSSCSTNGSITSNNSIENNSSNNSSSSRNSSSRNNSITTTNKNNSSNKSSSSNNDKNNSKKEISKNNSNSSNAGTRSSSSGCSVLTRKRRLIEDVEARLAIEATPYWEGGVDEGESEREEDGTPRRSRRGEARRRYEEVVGLIRERRKMAVNLPPMVSTREGKLLAVEVFGDDVLARLPAGDKGPRVGHCSSGYVCGHPVPRGKEGNLWCQTPVRASLESRMACTHHSHRRKGAGGPSKDQRRCMMLAVEFYDEAGDVCWPRVVSYLRSRAFPLERRRKRFVLTSGDRAVAASDAEVTLHGFAQCTFFWLAACRLTRRGYIFTMVAHESKAAFRDFLTELRASAAWPPPAQVSSPFVCVNDRSRASGSACYYASGYEKVCLMF